MPLANPTVRFPPEFEPAFYRAAYPDVRELPDDRLREHYDRTGRAEGRKATAASTRREFLSLISGDRRVLEIGPSSRPALKGHNVRYFDVLSTEQLRQRPGAPASFPAIDYVSPTGDLSVIAATFDVVFSSHSIEHQPDLVAHLRQVERILAPGGYYAVIAPDCRFCFDHHLPTSSIARVLDAHYSGRRVHALASIVEHRAMTGHNDPQRYWKEDVGSPGIRAASVLAALAEWKRSEGNYVDVHAWQFTPESFREIMTLLNQIGETRLFPSRVYDTPYGSPEFCAVLQIGHGTA